MSMFTLVILFDHFQFTLIHGPNIPGSCAILFFRALDFTSITSHIHNWVFFFHFGSISSFSLELFLYSSPIVYWAPPDLGSSSFSVVTFLPFHTVHGVLKARIHSGCHSLLQQLVSHLLFPRPSGRLSIFPKNSLTFFDHSSIYLFYPHIFVEVFKPLALSWALISIAVTLT